MKITQVLSTDRFDFTAIVECEHCGHTAKITNGYNDNNYHRRVMPAMRCKVCGKNRNGEMEHTDSGVSACSA